ncbi:TetR/AcrR family transcriptional regulator [Streptomyces litchfieldiae]|uniref:TetR/AcrR family transcriptional regulator n=1 Tax=Streptomyces litchfieldiae TaxID=3075543 RepID=A0ABU2MMT1_9ACTN|nr:TetR/AcrR family transcriptional regulator [Streptomyces sp. DSM 44938]MDT0341964.1 TetR/AcrR family transcriptional regulator [Streptomyces sp. DSM 44938]
MGNREDLLAGARRCLEEKGWARTTVRDISAASGGVSMAAIGYHFGSREALLNAALIEAIDEWGTRLGRTLASFGKSGGSDEDSAAGGAGSTPAERYEAMWAAIIESFSTDRTLWLATLEALIQAEHSADLRRYLAGGQAQGRRGLAAILRGTPEDEVDDATARTLGAAHMALFTGVLTQWLTDPDQAPGAAEIVSGLRELTGIVNDTGAGGS